MNNRHLLFFLPEEPPSWLAETRRHLTDYRVSTARSSEEAWKVVQDGSIEVVVGTPTMDSIAFFELLKNSNAQRPFLALVVNNTPDARQWGCADLLLPAIPAYVGRVLPEFLRLQKENQELRREKMGLAEENAQLKVKLQAQQGAVREIAVLKNAIVHNVSHELKTPLLQVKSAVALLAEDAGNSTLAEYALGATARLEGVVKNITQLSDAIDPTMGPVLVREIIEYAQRNLRRSWEHKDSMGRVQVQVEPNLPAALGNKHGLGTVMQLLIDNALKFSERDVLVSARRLDARSIELAVRDFGIGIAKDKFDRIFESFYQIDSSATRRYGGTGVGLAIVKLILDAHEVSVSVESKEGEGSAFSFLLPIVDIRAGATWKK